MWSSSSWIRPVGGALCGVLLTAVALLAALAGSALWATVAGGAALLVVTGGLVSRAAEAGRRAERDVAWEAFEHDFWSHVERRERARRRRGDRT